MIPHTFLWGAGSSSHQVEGNNSANDWWLWEKQGKTKELSGRATNHYELFAQDFDCARSLSHNAHRFSIEWSRIQPLKDKFDLAEVRHYQSVLRALRERGLEPVVTLHHFTNPLWFSSLGGWLCDDADEYFERYVQFIVESLGKDVRYWLTINEPMILAYYSYCRGEWPPGERSFTKMMRVVGNLAQAHMRAYEVIHAVYRAHGWKPPMVSFAKNMIVFKPCLLNQKPLNRFSVWLHHRYFNHWFIGKVRRQLDFIGVNYYSFNYIENTGFHPPGLLGTLCGHPDPKDRYKKNNLNYFIYPEGLYEVLLYLKKYRLPVMVTESGVCVDDDAARCAFIRDHVSALKKAATEGIEVLGYLYWSLTDNYEWDKGFKPRFGLVEVDYTTYARAPRPSAYVFAEICKNNGL